MMRLNAPIPALLALAALSFLPAKLLAKPTHHLVHKTTTSAPKQPRKKSSSQLEHATHNSKAVRSTNVVARANTKQPAHHLQRVSKDAAPQTTKPAVPTAEAVPQKATSEDFLKAASAKPETPQPDKPTTELPSRPTKGGEASTHARKPDTVAKPVSVVSVIRPTTQRPQLESIETEASTPVILPTLYNKRGRLIVPPPLKGSHEILLHQNQVADREGLDRIQNDDDLLDMRSSRMLVSLPVNNAIQVDERLPIDRRYCRPWTAEFLATLAREHYAHFHTALQVNSAVRTVEFQQRLMHINGNAAPADGDTASPHLTGQAIDIAKHGLSLTEIAWMRGYLLPLVQQGKVDVEEEFQQSCFHISVYKKYLPPADIPRHNLASSRNSGTAELATALR
jgi:Family of unknown function (DUF5715)